MNYKESLQNRSEYYIWDLRLLKWLVKEGFIDNVGTVIQEGKDGLDKLVFVVDNTDEFREMKSKYYYLKRNGEVD